jgi:hypothetical protein
MLRKFHYLTLKKDIASYTEEHFCQAQEDFSFQINTPVNRTQNKQNIKQLEVY